MRRTRRSTIAVVVAVAAMASACGGGQRPELTSDTLAPVSETTSTTTVTSPPTTSTTAPSNATPDGRLYPTVAADLDAAAARLYELEELLHTRDPTDRTWADLAHEQQMHYRILGRQPDAIPAIVAWAPAEHASTIETHLSARRAIANISHGGEAPVNVPAWEIIEPLPIDELRGIYEQAAADSGIDWAFLAAINMIETGFGRIDGISTAGAQGPMQFLPTTWEEVSDGDIRDPYDAIPAAALYLVRRGGPDDMHQALWGYNNSDAYVAAVTHYANLFRADEQALWAAHSWEIHYSGATGDLWFPVGYRQEEAMPILEYLDDAPWSAPPARP